MAATGEPVKWRIMAEFTGRILPLLWRRSLPARKPAGRPPRLSVDAVIGAGIRIADAEGLDAASMARVATELSVPTMTLYTYVPSRLDLVDLMVDEVLAGRGLDGHRPDGFRSRIHSYAERTFAAYRAHPWLAQVSPLRPPIGPGMLAEREYVLAAVAALGLPTAQVNTAAITIATWVVSAARQEAESLLLRRGSGLSSDEWWRQRGELWEKWFDVEAHPAMTALWNAGGFVRGADEQARDAYEFGLALLLDGIERSVPLGEAGRESVE
jgi:AcrR family transcriptional regulator